MRTRRVRRPVTFRLRAGSRAGPWRRSGSRRRARPAGPAGCEPAERRRRARPRRFPATTAPVVAAGGDARPERPRGRRPWTGVAALIEIASSEAARSDLEAEDLAARDDHRALEGAQRVVGRVAALLAGLDRDRPEADVVGVAGRLAVGVGAEQRFQRVLVAEQRFQEVVDVAGDLKRRGDDVVARGEQGRAALAETARWSRRGSAAVLWRARRASPRNGPARFSAVARPGAPSSTTWRAGWRPRRMPELGQRPLGGDGGLRQALEGRGRGRGRARPSSAASSRASRPGRRARASARRPGR